MYFLLQTGIDNDFFNEGGALERVISFIFFIGIIIWFISLDKKNKP